MDKKLLAIILVVLLVGTGIGYSLSWLEISQLKKDISELVQEVSEFKSKISDLENQTESMNRLIRDLNNSLNELLKAHSPTEEEYFFIHDANFTTPLDTNVFWSVEAWNANPDSLCEIRSGALHLLYNGTIDYSYGNSGVFQGTHADGRVSHPLLVGSSIGTSHNEEYVVFPRSIENGKFWLETKFQINRIGFNCYPTVYHTNFSRVNLGITLMCTINNQPFNLEAQTLWLDVYFAGYCLNTTHIWNVAKNWNYVAYEEDIHAGYFVSEVHQEDFGEWISLSVDLGDYITKTLNLISKVDIKTIRVYGFIVFVECLGAFAEVEYDYVNTLTH